MIPYLADPDLTLYVGDALEVLSGLPDESVHCAATSPPFYALRDYGVEGQIGLEETPELWVEKLVAVFRELRRVLRKDGTCWVECGDSYCANQGAGFNSVAFRGEGHVNEKRLGQATPKKHPTKPKDLLGQPWMLAFALRADGWYLRQCIIWAKPNAMPESATDRCTTAHSYVFLLSKSARYFFDNDAISEPAEWARWGDQTVSKYEGTQTSTGWMRPRTREQLAQISRPQTRRAWELFEQHGLTEAHLDAVRACGVSDTGKALVTTNGVGRNTPAMQRLADEAKAVLGGYYREFLMSATRTGSKNARSVWTIPTQGYSEAHFATWPEALVERIILAGTSEKGCCPECGAPWERETERTPMEVRSSERVGERREADTVNDARTATSGTMTKPPTSHTTGWKPTCGCGRGSARQHPVPCTVLDPFGGSGTTALVARRLNRRSILIELNKDYAELTAKRLQQLSLLAA